LVRLGRPELLLDVRSRRAELDASGLLVCDRVAVLLLVDLVAHFVGCAPDERDAADDEDEAGEEGAEQHLQEGVRRLLLPAGRRVLVLVGPAVTAQ